MGTEEQNKLIVDNMALAAWWANRYTGPFEDNYQIALLGLTKAIRAGKTVLESNGYIRAELSNALKRSTKWSNANLTPGDYVDSLVDVPSSPDVVVDLLKMEGCLTERDKVLLKMTVEGYPQKEIAKYTGHKSHQAIYQMLKYIRDFKISEFKPE